MHKAVGEREREEGGGGGEGAGGREKRRVADGERVRLGGKGV